MTTISGTSHPITAADNCHTLVYDNTVAGTAAFPNPSTLGASFSVSFLVYNGTLTMTKQSGATFAFKPTTTTTVLNPGDGAYVQPDDKGNWGISVADITGVITGP